MNGYEESNLWGKDLYTYLSDIYQKKAYFCIIFISKNYANKLWTKHERKAAQARAFEDSKEYILPVRFDNTEIPGISTTIGYIDLRTKTNEQFVEIILSKLSSAGIILEKPVPISYKEKAKEQDKLTSAYFKNKIFNTEIYQQWDPPKDIEVNKELNSDTTLYLKVEVKEKSQEFVVYIRFITTTNDQRLIGFGTIKGITNIYPNEKIIRIGRPGLLKIEMMENLREQIYKSGLQFSGIPSKINLIRFTGVIPKCLIEIGITP